MNASFVVGITMTDIGAVVVVVLGKRDVFEMFFFLESMGERKYKYLKAHWVCKQNANTKLSDAGRQENCFS